MSDDEFRKAPFDEEEDEEEEEREEGTRWESPLFDDGTEPAEIPEEMLVRLDADEDEADRDMARDDHYDTQHSDGHTYDVSVSLDQGLTYTPPTDPPIIPSASDPEGVEMAAGFALSMEDSNPDVEVLPEEVDNNDLDLEDDVNEEIRFNSETQNLTDVRVQARNGIVALFGTVPDDQDLARLIDLVAELPGVVRVLNHLSVEEEEGPVE